jgi:hypothetical protein
MAVLCLRPLPLPAAGGAAEAATAPGSLVVHFDTKTLQVSLTPSEHSVPLELTPEILNALDTSDEGLTPVTEHGDTTLDLEGRFQGVWFAVTDSDGETKAFCVTSLPPSVSEAARALRQANQRLLRAQRNDSRNQSVVLAAANAVSSATIVINTTDPPGVGFNDSTPATPVGGNTGVTLGQQRLNAFQYVASLWGSRITSAMPINVNAKFGPLSCTATSGTLASAGAENWLSFSSATVVPGPPSVTIPANTWVPIALAEKLSGANLNGSSGEIHASFNSNIGTADCLSSDSWYLGFDSAPPAHSIDFVSVLLHELGHGLGFATIVDKATGAKANGKDDMFMINLKDNGTGLQWLAMTDDQRLTSITNTNQVVWMGASVATVSGSILSGTDGAGHPEVFTPNPSQSGSSVSHWTQHGGLAPPCAACDELLPKDLMKPSYTSPTHTTFITHLALQDIGWGPVGSGACAAGEALGDNGFEAGQAPAGASGSSGTSGAWNWTSSAGYNPIVQPSGTSPIPTHSGSWYAFLNGYGLAETDTVYQQVSLPVGSTATLTFWLRVVSNETGSTVKDTLDVQVMNSSGSTELQRLARYSNLDASGAYSRKAFDLSSFAGQTVRIQFKGVEDASTATGFFIDDVSLVTSCDQTTNYTLTVAKGGTGTGTVTSDIGGISCGAVCSAGYANGGSVVLTAVAAGGSTFAGWSGAGCSGTATCTVAMTQNQNVTANFNLVGGTSPANFTVYRPGSGVWYALAASGSWAATQWGVSNDVPVPARFDGTGVMNVAVYRPSTGVWYVRNYSTTAWGVSGDVPVPGDFDGDGKADPAVYRPSTGTWFVSKSTGGILARNWGVSGDEPLSGDFDGDGKADFAVVRNSGGVMTWFVLKSAGGYTSYDAVQWGVSGDIPAPADYDGDGKADIAVFRPSTGWWYIKRSSDSGVTARQWGGSGDVPQPADYDGDGKADIAVYRPSNGTWYVIRSSDGAVLGRTWGVTGDVPVTAPRY